MLNLYQHVACQSDHEVQEASCSYNALTERHLQILWLEQKLIKHLITHQGEEVEVVSPGIWNLEAGPDFLRAHLRVGKREYRGDVEIHLHEGGWYQHNHHSDPRYNGVILHVSYGRSPHLLSINKENGQQALSCYLDNSLAIPPEQIHLSIDCDLYPSKIFPNAGHCAEHLFQSLPEARIKQFFQSAAYWRLEKKLGYLQLACPSPSFQLACGIAMGLGYRHNAKAFLELFLYLMSYRDLPYQELLAIALGCCGFLEEKRKESWESSAYYQSLRSLWWGRKSEMIHQTSLKLDHIRPLHHPVRRLAFLAHFLQDFHLENFWDDVLHAWEVAIAAPKMDCKKLKEKLLNIFPQYQDDYWDRHYTFEDYNQKKVLPYLGKDLKLQIMLNTVLPLLYATIKESGASQNWEKFQQFYASLEVLPTSKSRYLHQRFFGPQKNEQFLNQAQMVQGAYQLHQDFCVHYEASCKGCPFVERYWNLTKRR